MTDGIFGRDTGYCVGLATLYLSLGERLRLPLYAVAAPAYVFVRYDDGKIRRNIELTEKGRELSDEEYIRRFRIPNDSIEKGVFLRNLSEEEFLGQILNNRAVLSSQQEDYKRAREDYRRTLGLDPLLQAVFYNRGNDRILQGKYRKGLKDLTRAIDLNPSDFEAWNNRGVCFLKMGKKDQARRDFEKAVAINPGFQRGMENLRKLEKGEGPG